MCPHPCQSGHIQTGAGLAGSFTGNGVVDAADYTRWRDGLGGTYTQAHYDVWRGNFGAIAGSGSSATAPDRASTGVPEPTSLVLVELDGLFATFVFVRRHQPLLAIQRARAVLAARHCC